MSAPDDTPLYVVVMDGEWFAFDEDAWADIALMSDDPEGEDYD